jgi:hypothetical protein
MRAPEAEAWALEYLRRRRGTEDQRIELKQSLTDPARAARRLAGHANAARGAQIMWLVGVADDGTIHGYDVADDPAKWLAQVRASIQGNPPRLTADVIVHVDGATVLALVFETTGAPYVVSRPGDDRLEVPWREGTSVRSARHEDLVEVLVPVTAAPTFEALRGSLTAQAQHDEQGNRTWIWKLDLELYASTAVIGEAIAIPDHNVLCRVVVETVVVASGIASLSPLPKRPPAQFVLEHFGVAASMSTVFDGDGQLILTGPGRVDASASLTDATPPWPTNTDRPARVDVVLSGATSQGVPFESTVTLVEETDAQLDSWKVALTR